MILKQLALINFRNYQQQDFVFQEGTNVIFGKNGQGKTNILESIYYLALTKSFRANKDQNLILHSKPYFRIQGEFQTTQGRIHNVSSAYSMQEGKRLIHNNQRIQKFADYIGKIPVVLLAPADLEISQGGPQQRRQVLDILLSQSSSLYLHQLLQYRRTLKQRNTLLSENTGDPDVLQSWDEALIQHGSAVIRKRLEAVEVLDPLIKELYQKLSGASDKIKLVYRSSFSMHSGDSIESGFRNAIDESRQKELAQQTSLVGPHRDDVLVLINGKPLRLVGSQGEHKTFVISLKMAEKRYLQTVQNEPPILLFDDIFGELDAGRITNMIGSLPEIGQVFITTTSPRFFDKFSMWNQKTSFYEIEKGAATLRSAI